MPRYSDAAYAAALDTRSPGDLPAQGQTDAVMRNGTIVDVPTGKMLANLRSQGRRTAPDQLLVDALARHGLPLCHMNGLWKLEPTCKHVKWTDAEYAAALNTRPPGDLPAKGQKDTVVLNGRTVEVPIGRMLYDLRTRGRRKALEEVLAEAVERHGLTPHLSSAERLWKLTRSGSQAAPGLSPGILRKNVPEVGRHIAVLVTA